MENGITEQNMQHAVSVDATCNSLLALHNKAKLKPMLPANKQFNHNILLKKTLQTVSYIFVDTGTSVRIVAVMQD